MGRRKKEKRNGNDREAAGGSLYPGAGGNTPAGAGYEAQLHAFIAERNSKRARAAEQARPRPRLIEEPLVLRKHAAVSRDYGLPEGSLLPEAQKRAPWRFRGAAYYGVEAKAICAGPWSWVEGRSDEKAHESPHWGCTCGFYAYKPEHRDLYQGQGPSRGHAELTVEFYGHIIAHEFGYRAEYQRVLAACYNPPQIQCEGPNLFGDANEDAHQESLALAKSQATPTPPAWTAPVLGTHSHQIQASQIQAIPPWQRAVIAQIQSYGNLSTGATMRMSMSTSPSALHFRTCNEQVTAKITLVEGGRPRFLCDAHTGGLRPALRVLVEPNPQVFDLSELRHDLPTDWSLYDEGAP